MADKTEKLFKKGIFIKMEAPSKPPAPKRKTATKKKVAKKPAK